MGPSSFAGARMWLLCTALAALGIMADAGKAWAVDDCEEGKQYTLSGVLSSAWRRTTAGVVADIAKVSPCYVDMVVVSQKQAPSSCVNGASFVATGTTGEYIESWLDADTISCR